MGLSIIAKAGSAGCLHIHLGTPSYTPKEKILSIRLCIVDRLPKPYINVWNHTGNFMSKRLTKQDWILHGFEVLRADGHLGLKADRMVKTLGVSRGSFYWHFADIQTFHAALIVAWREQINKDVIAQLQLMADTTDQIRALIERIFTMSRPLERGMRMWAGANPMVDQAIREIDGMRRAFVYNIFLGLGLPKPIAESRAQMMMWAYVGHALSDEEITNPAVRAADFTRILTSPVEV